MTLHDRFTRKEKELNIQNIQNIHMLKHQQCSAGMRRLFKFLPIRSVEAKTTPHRMVYRMASDWSITHWWVWQIG